MGTGFLADSVTIRDATVKNRFLVINADGSINVTQAVGDVFEVTNAIVPATLNIAIAVAVTDAQTQLAAGNASRKSITIQNHAANVLQVYFTGGQPHLSGPILLQQYQSVDIGCDCGSIYQGIVYGIRAAGQTGNAGVVEEI
jgi:hypothetical protein